MYTCTFACKHLPNNANWPTDEEKLLSDECTANAALRAPAVTARAAPANASPAPARLFSIA